MKHANNGVSYAQGMRQCKYCGKRYTKDKEGVEECGKDDS